MKLTKNTSILIVGLGVIGGGYAAALSAKGYRVSCITKEQKDIAYALERGMIADGCDIPPSAEACSTSRKMNKSNKTKKRG